MVYINVDKKDQLPDNAVPRSSICSHKKKKSSVCHMLSQIIVAMFY